MPQDRSSTNAEPPTATGDGPVQQPYLHDLVSCLSAPSVCLSGADGQLRAGRGHGFLRHDRRVLSELVVEIDGHEPVPIGHHPRSADRATFVGIVRHLGDPNADPTVRLERERAVRADGLDERLVLINAARSPVTATLTIRAATDFAAMTAVKHSATTTPARPSEASDHSASWSVRRTRLTLRTDAASEPRHEVDAAGRYLLRWRLAVPPRSRQSVEIAADITDLGGTPSGTFLPAAGIRTPELAVSGPPDLVRLAERGIEDLAALAMADPDDPTDAFFGAGSPWFFTLFGRDSLLTARFLLPLGTELARGTLRTLARRQGTTYDEDTAEAPGKILHEVRGSDTDSALPPLYFGTVDATPLWINLLHDAWRWGMPTEHVAELIDPLERALRWLTEDADSDGDGFAEYLDRSGRGLANQGWKDSGDSIQFRDGRIAAAPIALCEAQAYAHEAAISGAALLDAFGRPGSDRLHAWAAALRDRFRHAFWVSDVRGRFPAIALDGAKTPVATATSNLGHLLGTGLLDKEESAAVANRLAESDLDCGYGLRTMSADAAGFNPLGYHTGSVWPHDTAIAVQGLADAGFPAAASSLAAGILRAAPAFDHRVPELFAGTDARAGEPVLAYPAACRPQAWSAAAVVAMLRAALGLAVDVPAGVVRVAPHPEFGWLYPLRVAGLRVAGHALTIEVAANGAVRVETSAPLSVQHT